MSTHMLGVVRWFDYTKKFGEIAADDGSIVRVNLSAFLGREHDLLKPQDNVEFDMEQEDGLLVARNVLKV